MKHDVNDIRLRLAVTLDKLRVTFDWARFEGLLVVKHYAGTYKVNGIVVDEDEVPARVLNLLSAKEEPIEVGVEVHENVVSAA
jgi:myosin heavy subunit